MLRIRIQILFRLLRRCKELKILRSIHGQLTVLGVATGDHSFAYTSLLFAFTQLTELAGPREGDGVGVSYPVALFRRITGPASSFHHNLLIRSHFLLGRPSAAVDAFRRLRAAGLDPDSHTLPFVLRAAALLPLPLASSLHSLAAKLGFLPSDAFVANILLSVYSSRNLMRMAQSLFEETPSPGIVTRNALIDGYAKSGDIPTARKVFDEMPARDVVSWGTMLAGYAQGERFHAALHLFDRMDIPPDDVALVSVLSCCAAVGALDRGRKVHDHITQTRGRKYLSVYLTTALVDMYSKCGGLRMAREIFEAATERNVWTYNAMIVGAAVNGEGAAAVGFFHRMVAAGVGPDGVSFLGVLAGCSHAGMVGLARELFREMEGKYGVTPELKHYGCMADLLGRSGMIREAMEMVEEMRPMQADAYVWGAILGGCRIHGEVAVAEIAAGHLLRMNPGDSGIYSAMADVYAAAGRWEDVARMRRVMDHNRVLKNMASSSIQDHEITSHT